MSAVCCPAQGRQAIAFVIPQTKCTFRLKTFLGDPLLNFSFVQNIAIYTEFLKFSMYFLYSRKIRIFSIKVLCLCLCVKKKTTTNIDVTRAEKGRELHTGLTNEDHRVHMP